MSFKLAESSNGHHAFVIRSTDPNQKKPTNKFYCVAPNAEESMSWQLQFEMVLNSQKDFMKALQFPIKHQNELQKPSAKDEKSKK